MQKPVRNLRISSSFRDPSGFVFWRDGDIYRQINLVYQSQYNCLMQSGLYEKLVKENLILPHIEAEIPPEEDSTAYKIIKPEIIPFISYPYEWCFSQLKSAALTMLRIQKIALQFDMTLKDASAYNIQFRKGKPILIDTLSFENYQEGSPWIAYRQFCQHFLGPLALMAFTDVRLNQLARIYLDGIPLDLLSALLPKSSWLKFGILWHLHLHAKSQKSFGNKNPNIAKYKISKTSLMGIIGSLEKSIQKMDWQPEGTEWGNYYEDTNYTPKALNDKKRIILQYLCEATPNSVWDIGANTGRFSRLASDRGIQTISSDIDAAAVEKNYREVIHNNEQSILPLILDLTNPSPGIGWENNERIPVQDRFNVDLILALALIHHLAISNNLPFRKIASFLSSLSRYCIIEFVPKSDSQVQRLLASRNDTFHSYTQYHFEKDFSDYFQVQRIDHIMDSERTLYLFRTRTEKEDRINGPSGVGVGHPQPLLVA